MASAADFDLSQLSASQQEALRQYTDFTSQEVKEAVPLLQRSQWNVQVHPALMIAARQPANATGSNLLSMRRSR